MAGELRVWRAAVGQEPQEPLEAGEEPVELWEVVRSPASVLVPGSSASWGRYTFSNFASR